MTSSSENYSFATIGAGTMVIVQDHVLLVQLGYGIAKDHWILPGGMVEQGEHPSQAAIRETLEETGLEVKIDFLLNVRHRIYKEVKANIYYVFKASPTSDISLAHELKWPEGELLCARFWPISEALQSKEVRPLTRVYIEQYLKSADKNKGFSLLEIPEEHTQNDELFGV